MNQLEVKLNEKRIIKKMNALFITYRKRFLSQYRNKDGVVTFLTTTYPLADWAISRHLCGDKTIGVLLGDGGMTKFFTFDVDIKDNLTESREVTRRLVNFLIDRYGIAREDIHVSVSGQKGYHVDLYFDSVFFEHELIPFYNEVLSELNETPDRIERRPTKKYGVKLPLGYHLVTETYCGYVDNQTFEPVGLQYFFNIKPMSWEEFSSEILCGCSMTSVANESVFPAQRAVKKKRPKIFVEFHKDTMQKMEVEEIFVVGHLLRSGTRNNFTVSASAYLRDNGDTEKEAREKILQVLENTINDPQNRKFINMTNLKTLKRETARVVGNVYTKDYKISKNSHATKIEIYSGELKAILSIGNSVLARLLFVLLIHSKRFSDINGVFFCTYQQLAGQGIDKNRGRTLDKLKALQDLGLLEIIRENAKFSSGAKRKPANLYRTRLLSEQGEDFISVECTGIVSVENMVDTFATLSDQEKKNLKSLGLKYNFDLIE
ncbi:MAG: DNA primase [Enterococcus avium]|jgi:hypothetical protein|uniref:DNA primase n=1 Tax=Enterococcus avium TaxID=33945 RepID=A0A437UN60_ENTAV|nr:DNA primase [Enterococcus avium]RVU95055.1 DNA primase [Enterococcus avium]